MLSYKLNQQIDGNRLLKDIQKLITKETSQDKEYLLVIRIQEINYNNHAAIPKLTYEPLENI